jgi:hypothetical protein
MMSISAGTLYGERNVKHEVADMWIFKHTMIGGLVAGSLPDWTSLYSINLEFDIQQTDHYPHVAPYFHR